MKRQFGLRRLATVGAGLVLALTGVVAVDSPAQAVCIVIDEDAGHDEVAGNYIHAWRYLICENGNVLRGSVKIDRNLSPGVWQTVANGLGETTYHCKGTAGNFYRTTGTPQFWILCG